MDLKVYVDTWLKGDFDMAVAQNGGRPDPYPMYNRYFTKDGNLIKVSNFADPELDKLLQEGRSKPTSPKRKPIFQAFEQRLAEQAPGSDQQHGDLHRQPRHRERLCGQSKRIALLAEQGDCGRVILTLGDVLPRRFLHPRSDGRLVSSDRTGLKTHPSFPPIKGREAPAQASRLYRLLPLWGGIKGGGSSVPPQIRRSSTDG